MLSISLAFDTLLSLDRLGGKKKLKLEMLTAAADNEALRTVFRATYDWMVSYGFRADEPEPKDAIAAPAGPAEADNFHTFLRFLAALSERRLTGNRAARAWELLRARCGVRERVWYQRILNRNLRVNVGYAMIEQVWPDLLSPFGCQLANNFEDHGTLELSDRQPFLKLPIWVEPKLDGYRAIAVVTNDKARIHSREGHELENVQDVADSLLAAKRTLQLPDFVVDGELVAISEGQASFNLTSSLLTRLPRNMTPEDHERLRCLRYVVFDFLTLSEFRERGCTLPLRMRRRRLREVVNRLPTGHKVRVVQHEIAETLDEAERMYANLLSRGHEGAMYKFPGAPYDLTRNNHWLKRVPTLTVDVRIIDILPGEINKANQDVCGRLVVEDRSGARYEVGSGFTREMRDYLWKNREALIGEAIAEIEIRDAQQYEGRVRFGVFLRLRPDRKEV